MNIQSIGLPPEHHADRVVAELMQGPKPARPTLRDDSPSHYVAVAQHILEKWSTPLF
jgi:hypothetical protein